MISANKYSAEDISWRFGNNPGELEIIINNRKLGIESEGMKKWSDCDLLVLESGLRLIRQRQQLAMRNDIVKFVLVPVLIVAQIYLMVLQDERDMGEALISTIRIILLMVPILILRRILYGEDSPWEQAERMKEGIFEHIARIMLIITIFLILINLFVGAL